jgi:hypothetical protein
LVIQQLTLLFFILVRSGLWIEKKKKNFIFNSVFFLY